MMHRDHRAHAVVVAAAVVLLASIGGTINSFAQEQVSFRTADGATIFADVYGSGERAVVLAHGGRFNKESWKHQAHALERAGFRVLALDFRGYGASRGPGQEDVYTAPLHVDVLAAVRYLRGTGAKEVSVIGGSLGGEAAANAAAEAPAEIDRIVLLGADLGRTPEKVTVPKLLIVTRDDASGSGPRLPEIQGGFERAPEPKRLVILDGSAHAQAMFETTLADRILQEILQFLSVPQRH